MTDLKRVAVYFTEDEKQEIEALSETLGQSMSSVIGDVTRQALPQLRTIAQAVNLAKDNPEQAMKMIRSAGYEAQQELIGEMKDLDQ